MQQGTYLKIPDTGDRGNSFCPAISEDLTILDTHNHDGVNSAPIASKSLQKGLINLEAANWIETDTDFKQTINLPSGYNFDLTLLKFIITSGVYIGKEITPTINKVSPTSFDVHCLLGNIDVKVVLI